MPHSTVTSKGQTTIPGEIRRALNIRAGDRLEYAVEGKYATLRVALGAQSLKGALASDRGRGMTFEQIRHAAAEASGRKVRRR